MNSIKFKCPECGQALTFNDILHVETIDEIKNTLCPYCKMLISKEEITRQIQSNVARRIEAMLGGALLMEWSPPISCATVGR
ncbi:hypothetical protein HV321_28195 [Klebsiella pneumoniae]|uniref:ECs_2282 family putative zinc-binding protein n=1 Tax=Klebsiella pneumoniae TaxID=573 RepID=UPI0015F37E93|nr:hypothetical protein [Klebsiella pneumoniae]MBA7838171.1 hypothetical protein [Klebsiella pneumoniae]